MRLVFVAALAFAAGGCLLPGYVDISPAEAQRIEKAQCESKADAEERRKCLAAVARKYHRYNSEGGYPEPFQPPNPRQ